MFFDKSDFMGVPFATNARDVVVSAVASKGTEGTSEYLLEFCS
jgi:hypothetical protein